MEALGAPGDEDNGDDDDDDDGKMIIAGNRWEFKVEYLVHEEMPPSVH